MKRIAVFFPGIGYTADKPLLHYSRRLAADAGFEILLLPYSGFPQKVKGDRSKMEESCRIALSQAREMLSDTNFTTYEKVLMIGKSIGTVVAAETAAKCAVQDRIHMVLYTPLEETFSFPLGDTVVFTGGSDPWVKEGRIAELCRQREIPCHVIPKANHSLETGDVQNDIENMRKIMKKTDQFIRKI